MTSPELMSDGPGQDSNRVEPAELAAIIAEFPTASRVMAAAKRVSEAGWSDWDVHSPFPIHGIDEVLRIRSTRLPWFTLAAGVTGIIAALGMQWWMNAVDYKFWISGKPFFAFEAAAPIAFEMMILFAAIATLGGMLALNQLPKFSNHLFNSERFLRATSDRFFIVISASDPKFDRDVVTKLFEDCHATAIDSCISVNPREGRLPALVPALIAIAAVMALIPPALIAQKRSTTTKLPRYHAITDMDFQPKFKPQRASHLFADGRAMRPQPAGTIARGEMRLDRRLHEGLDTEPISAAPVASINVVPISSKAQPSVTGMAGAAANAPGALPSPDPLDSLPWVQDFPIAVTSKAMKRGQERYNIYCSSCHGLAGDGDGLVTRRALELEQGTWIKPTSFHSENVAKQPVGRLFNSITHGVRKMPGYGDLIPVEDRWAILLYLRALQQSRTANVQDVPADMISSLRELPKE
ncbi:MAG: quinol:electron acceptor oxidoreductase subunit ActD [Schlesneria sp.]